MTYQAPLHDFRFIFQYLLSLDSLLEKGDFADCDEGLIYDMLEQAGRFCADILFPAYDKIEKTGAKLADKQVILSDLQQKIYKEFCQGGYGTVSAPVEHGGMGLPYIVFTAIVEMISASNMGFGLCPLLTQGAIHALQVWGNAEQKERYLPKLTSGEWTGTMNLTEPQAGSAVGDITTKAVKQSDGTYLIFGSKIFITYGDHNLSDNIIHLVLARLPDAPKGTKGISLFLVPKILLDKEGNLASPNKVYPTGVEEKLGIHSSPTCSMQFDEAIGYLIGEENQGMRCMFTMMNDARLQVGVQGLGAGEIAFQKALAYAKDRRQGDKIVNSMKEVTDYNSLRNTPIINHPDVQRQLMTMRSTNFIARMIVLKTAFHTDMAHHSSDLEEKSYHQAYADFLTPIAKIFPTEMGVKNTSRAMQVFGGIGYVEETKIACHFRDVRITPIYEGTNGIQAIDLITRKLGKDEMKIFRDLCQNISELSQKCLDSGEEILEELGDVLEFAGDDLLQAGEWMYQKWWLLDQGVEALAGAEPFAELCGIVIGAYYALDSLYKMLDAEDTHLTDLDKDYMMIIKFYFDNILGFSKTLSMASTRGSKSLSNIVNW